MMTAESTHPRVSVVSVNVRDAALLTSFSEYEIRSAINSGALEAHKSGPRLAILIEDLRAWVASLPSTVAS